MHENKSYRSSSHENQLRSFDKRGKYPIIILFSSGGTSESLAVGMKESLKRGWGLKGFLDVDDLKTINRSGITAGILQSCSILLFLVSPLSLRLYYTITNCDL